MLTTLRSIFAWAALAVLVSGCQSTSIRSAWYDTSFAGPPMTKLVVTGNLVSLASERILEDTFVAQLRAKGIDAVAGHTLRLDDPTLSQAAFESAVVNSGAQGLLLVTLLGVDTRTQVTTTMVQGGMGWGRGPWGSPVWGAPAWGAFPVQEVSQYDIATAETKLFDVKTRQLVWAATTSTFNPGSVAREAPGFAELIIGQLTGRRIVAAK